MSRIVHFEIHAADPDRLQAFYGGLFGWSFHRWGAEEYWLVSTAPEGEPGVVNGGLLRRRGPAPEGGQAVNAFVCTFQVDSVDRAFDQALALGGVEAVPKMPIPGVGWLAYVTDPDGNILGLLQPDADAKG